MIEQNSLILDGDNSTQAVAESPREAPPARDMPHAMMTLPVAEQNYFLAEYKARRKNFRDWLEAQLIEGVHFGVVPGCEPKSEQRPDGTYYGVWNKKKSAFDWHHERQWKPKPSLYAAGADFICDICRVRDEYEPDLISWQQMGSKPGNACVKCRLVSRDTKELIGESLGAYYHQYDPNNALKMACKCAKVGAVINAYDLRDLFTQDEASQPPHDNPTADEQAPQAASRATRKKPQTEVSEEQLGHVTAEWKSRNPEPDGNLLKQKDNFYKWVLEVNRRTFKPKLLAEWKLSDYQGCCAALGIPTLEELEGLNK